MPYKLFHSECKKLKYDLELLQNTFATSFEQVAHRVTCLQDPKLPGIPFHFLRVDMAGNISKRFSLSGIDIPRYGGACPRWNVYSAFTRPGVIQAAVSKMNNGEKYVCTIPRVDSKDKEKDNKNTYEGQTALALLEPLFVSQSCCLPSYRAALVPRYHVLLLHACMLVLLAGAGVAVAAV